MSRKARPRAGPNGRTREGAAAAVGRKGRGARDAPAADESAAGGSAADGAAAKGTAPVLLIPLLARIGRQAAWPMAAVLLAHEVLAAAFGHEPMVDPLMHLAGGMASAFFVRGLARMAGAAMGAPSALALDLLGLGGAAVIAQLWELYERIADFYYGNQPFQPEHMMRDLALGFLGGAIYVGCRRMWARFRGGVPPAAGVA